MFNVFKVQYNKAIKEAFEAKNKDLPERARKKFLSDQEKSDIIMKLIDFHPIIKTFLAARDDRKDYLSLMTTSKQRMVHIPEAGHQQKYSYILRDGHKSKASYVSSIVPELEGVRGGPISIQSIETAVMALLLNDRSILNVYDAAGHPIGEATEGTRLHNEYYHLVNTQYTLIDEVEAALAHTLTALAKHPGDLIRTNKAIATQLGFKNFDIHRFHENFQKEQKKTHERRKLLEQTTTVNQFAFMGTGFHPEAKAPKDETPEKSFLDPLLNLIRKDPSKGSTSLYGIDFENFVGTYENTISSENAIQIFDKLFNYGNVIETPKRQQILRNLLNITIKDALAPLDNTPLQYTLKVNEEGELVYGGIKGTEIAISAGAFNGPRLAMGNLNQISAQETYVHELLHAVTQYAIENNHALGQQLKALFEQAKKHVKIEDFLYTVDGKVVTSVDAKAEYAAAKERFDYIFNNPKGDQLHEFLAFGLTNAKFASIISKIDAKPPVELKQNDLWGWMEYLFKRLLEFVNERIRGQKNMKIDEALLRLTEKLVNVNTSYYVRIMERLAKFHELDPKLTEAMEEKIFKPIKEWHKEHRDDQDQGIIKKAAHASISAVRGLPGLARNEDFHRAVSQAREEIRRTGNRLLQQIDENMADIGRDLAGPSQNALIFHVLHRMSKKFVDQSRRHLAENITEHIDRDFINDQLTKEDQTALYRILLKANVGSLWEDYNLVDIVHMIQDDKKLQSTINAIQDELLPFNENDGAGYYYINQGTSMGRIMATGKASQFNPMLNGYNVANMTSVPYRKAKGDLVKAEKLIEQLATLNAIKNTSSHYRKLAGDVILREHILNYKLNGITTTLELHKQFREDSVKALFENNKTLMRHGYVRDIFDEHVSVAVGTEVEHKALLAQGFQPVSGVLKRDPHDLNQEPLRMYVSKYNPMHTRVKGGVSFTSKKRRGQTTYESLLGQDHPEASKQARENTIHMLRANRPLVEKQFTGILPEILNENIMIPSVNKEGKIREYRYEMSEHIKDTHLNKDNNFRNVLGRMHGNLIDKVNSKIINDQHVEALHADYVDNYAKNPSAFVRIAADTKDPEYKELWNLLPEEMKEKIRTKWKGEEVYVRREVVKIVFGFRKLSVFDLKAMEKFEKSSIGQAMKVGIWGRQAEEIWQEVVRGAKDWIVIKSFVVLKDNVISNAWLLWTKGVPLQDVFKYKAEAIQALDAYHADVKKRDIVKRTLETRQNLTASERKELKSQLTFLDTRIGRNPVKPLIDEGIFQNIVEDLDLNEDQFSYKSKFMNRIAPGIEQYIPDTATSVFKYAYLTKDNMVYRQLLKATQYSDFVARYALYKHRENQVKKLDPKEFKQYEKLNDKKDKIIRIIRTSKLTPTQRKVLDDELNRIDKKLSKNKAALIMNDALIEIIDTFINYDLPTSPLLQYANDMGVLMFTKFLLRIQRIIYRQLKERPVSVISLELMKHGITDFSTILESNLITSSLRGRLKGPMDIIDDFTHLAGVEAATFGAF